MLLLTNNEIKLLQQYGEAVETQMNILLQRHETTTAT
jgi:hypothetical protein